MSRDLTKEALGAVFTEKCESIAKLRERGAITGSPTISTGLYGENALAFAYADRCVFPATSLPAIPATGGWTIDLLVKMTDLPGGTPAIVGLWSSVQNFILRLDTSNRFQLVYNNGGTRTLVATTRTPTLNQWSRVTVTVANGSQVIYVDGIADGTASQPSSFVTGAEQLVIGAKDAAGNDPSSCHVAELSIWPRALSAAEALQLATNKVRDYERTLVSRWGFGDINPQDLGPGGNNAVGTNIAAADIFDGPYPGMQYVDLDGSSEFFTIGDISETMGTISMLIYLRSPITPASSVQIPINIGNANAGVFLGSGTSSLTDEIITVSGGSVDTFRCGWCDAAGSISAGWHHLVVAWNGSAYEIILDGSLKPMTTFGTPVALQLDGVLVGKVTASTIYFDGGFADLEVYSSGLSQLQAQDLLNSFTQGVHR